MGLQLTKHRNEGLRRRNKAFSENNLVSKERMMRSALSWKFVRFRNRLRIKRPCSEAATTTTEVDCTSKQDSFVKCDSRQVKSMYRLNSATTTFQEIGISKTYAHSISLNSALNRPTDLQLRAFGKLNTIESADTLETGHRQTENDNNWSFITDNKPSRCCSAEASTAQNILNQTVAYFAYEIEPFLIKEFQHSRRSHRKGVEITSDLLTCDCNSIESVRNFLSMLMRDPLSEDYRLFCDLLRDQGSEHYVADFLEVLSATMRLLNTSTSKESSGSSYRINSVTGSDQKPKQFSECTCLTQEDFTRNNQRFDVSLVYVDRESRTAKSFKGVTSMKRRKHRKSRVELSGVKVQLGDTSDRYIPMMSVHLYKQCLCDNRMRSLQRLVETYSCIRDLSIVKTQLEDQAKIRLGRALEQNIGLYQLDVSLSALGNDGALYIAEALRSNRFLRVLNLSSNELTARGCDFLVKGLLGNRTLNDLDLGFNEIEDQGSISLAGALEISKCCLRRLRLRNNGITSRGATELFAALRKNSRLCLLDLSSNDIGDECLRTLSDMLIYNRTLTDLVIDNCRLSEKGCPTLARPLKINTVLRRLSLNMNPIADAGLKSLVDAIKYNRSVTEISLNMCGITNSGLWHLLDATHNNTTIKTIKLCYNLIDICSKPKNGDYAFCERRASAFVGQNASFCSSPKAERRASLFVVGRSDIMSVGESKSEAFFDHDVISGEDITRSELYAKLVEILHNNSPLKVFLWGNRLDDINSAISESLLTDDFSY